MKQIYTNLVLWLSSSHRTPLSKPRNLIGQGIYCPIMWQVRTIWLVKWESIESLLRNFAMVLKTENPINWTRLHAKHVKILHAWSMLISCMLEHGWAGQLNPWWYHTWSKLMVYQPLFMLDASCLIKFDEPVGLMRQAWWSLLCHVNHDKAWHHQVLKHERLLSC